MVTKIDKVSGDWGTYPGPVVPEASMLKKCTECSHVSFMLGMASFIRLRLRAEMGQLWWSAQVVRLLLADTKRLPEEPVVNRIFPATRIRNGGKNFGYVAKQALQSSCVEQITKLTDTKTDQCEP